MRKLIHPTVEYSRYINKSRAIPDYRDCLAPIHRRLLLVSWELWKLKTKTNQNKPIKKKCAAIAGTVISKYHPHGDASAYESLVNLVHRGFFTEDANFGNNIDKESRAGSMRYTETRPNTEIFKLFWDYMDKDNTIGPWVRLELEELEPPFLISPIPIGLIGNTITQAIGGSFASKIPQYTVSDLFKRLKYLLTLDENDKIIIKPNIKGCISKEVSPNAFEEILTKGKGKIDINPTFSLRECRIDKKIIKYMLYNGVNPISKLGEKSLPKKADKKVSNRTIHGYNIQYANEDNEDGNKRGIMYCDVRSTDIGIDISKKNILDRKVSIFPRDPNVEFDSNFVLTVHRLMCIEVNIDCNVYTENETVERIGIDDLILKSYNNWKQYLLYELNKNLDAKKKELFYINALNDIKVVYNQFIQNKMIPTEEMLVEKYTGNQTITPEVIHNVLQKFNIQKFINNKDFTQKILSEIEEYQNQIKNIDKTTLDFITTQIIA